ncbi:tyrosine-type recombinase/integrase [Salipiger bermudensis]|uniref:Probable site-specific integrase/recombinase n=1 Tax=Salipiger bermudensis (strain DSM 26914 / JCM 13377 / KCTC 12554 / HTCC2601) TaxID=314265 RepID=Q0FPA2_SALBH|nr:site-specific integrase [Salipiger bermudensis]EAU45957.1 probable site-specific integrase/recombinase [Salipiger bermudensis HTCC2601]
MAAIRNRNGKWHAQVRIKGHASQTKSFTTKRDAERWAKQTEAELQASALRIDIRVLDRVTVRDLLERYRREVTATKRGAASESKRIDGFLRQTWVDRTLSKVTPQVFSRYRDERLRTVRPGTVIRDLGLLRSIFEVARLEWDVPLQNNPLANVRKPKAPDPRERRLRPGELDLLLTACQSYRNDWLRAGIVLAIETGMRRGEILSIRWCDVSMDTSTLTIRETKNGHARRIPLTAVAVDVLRDMLEVCDDSSVRIFPVSANAFRQCWQRCKGKVAEDYKQIESLRFHDLRHEAVSRFFEMGLSVPEVALISGHRDPRMLFRYTHLRAENIVLKFNKAGSAA